MEGRLGSKPRSYLSPMLSMTPTLAEKDVHGGEETDVTGASCPMDSGGLKMNGSPLSKIDTGHASSVNTGNCRPVKASFSLQPWLCNPPVFWKPWGQASHRGFFSHGPACHLAVTWSSFCEGACFSE